MGRRVSIPVRVIRPTEDSHAPAADEATRPAAGAAVPNGRTGTDIRPHKERPEEQEAVAVETPKSRGEENRPELPVQDELREEIEDWRSRALRLQADMENYRKRQQRNAQHEIEQERDRLLNAFLDIVDDLERAMATPDGSDDWRGNDGLRRGVELTHRAAIKLLEKEGAFAIAAEHQPFDPNWHEAVATIPRNGWQVAPGTVVEVVEPGYRLGERLLRPAKVVVAV